MERLCWFCCTFALGVLVICLGSVIAWGAGRFWGKARVLIEMTMASTVKERIGGMKSLAEVSVILTGAGISLREILATSTNPYQLYEAGGRIITKLRKTLWLSASIQL